MNVQFKQNKKSKLNSFLCKSSSSQLKTFSGIFDVGSKYDVGAFHVWKIDVIQKELSEV